MNDFKKLKSTIKLSSVLSGEGYSLIPQSKDIFKMRCCNPSHNDHKPSFTIKDSIGNFKCWSCGINGDIFNILDYIKPEIKGERAKVEFYKNNYLGKETPLIFPLLGGLIKKNIQDQKSFRKIMLDIALYWSQSVPKDILDTYLMGTNSFSYRAFNGEVITMQGYGLNKDTIGEFKIGYSPNNSKLFKELLLKYDKESILETRLFDSKGLPKFKNRIVIPYIINNDVVYFTARQTNLTPSNEFEEAKYMNQSIDNKYFYNEGDINNPSIFITEGAFDTLALKQIGYSAIALSGIDMNNQLTDKLIDTLKESYMIYIIFDNDRNEAGNKKASKLQSLLSEKGIDSNIIVLPLKKGQKKIDINEYLGKHSKQEFNKLLTF